MACGQCSGCRLERSKQWAIRCVHEAQLHEVNCFITLTYRDAALPRRYFRGVGGFGRRVYGGTLVKKHFQDFMKRVRHSAAPEAVQYFHCGEYGETTRRPHYHALLFGVDFFDKVFYRKSADGSSLFQSPLLEKLWGHGFCTVGALTFESAAYCARYVMKKVNGDRKADHYREFDRETGEVFDLEPEYCTMSLKRPIGKEWIGKFQGDVYPDDFVVLRGVKMKPPRYYDRELEARDPEARAQLRVQREETNKRFAANQTPARLAVREAVQLARISTLKRSLE